MITIQPVVAEHTSNTLLRIGSDANLVSLPVVSVVYLLHIALHVSSAGFIRIKLVFYGPGTTVDEMQVGA